MPRPMDRRSSYEDDEEDKNGSSDRLHEQFINHEDGLAFSALDEANRQQRILHELAAGAGHEDSDDENDEYGDEFPTTVIVTGFDAEFFEDETLKQRLEALFSSFGSDATFYYFRSFKRVRISYGSAASAVEARIKMHLFLFGDYVLKCYFGQVLKKRNDKGDGFLHPPTPDKQFLISPPASPPVDWEPCPESHPILDYDLIAALAKLGPGDKHELHKPESESHPSIVVHIAEDMEFGNQNAGGGMKIVHTKRPDVAS